MIKRIIDIIFSASALILLFIPLVVIASFVRIKLGAPIFFIQSRAGLHGKTFKMVKFRTMTDQTDSAGHLLPDEARLTKFGKLLRSSSMDELPELWNVLIGDMSLVGPRPLLLEYLPLYSANQFRRHEVSPGITGWAQVNGRNLLNWEDKFVLDVWYVDNQSLFLDTKIIVLTAIEVIMRNGINARDGSAMPKFNGYNKAGDSN